MEVRAGEERVTEAQEHRSVETEIRETEKQIERGRNMNALHKNENKQRYKNKLISTERGR